MLKKDPRAALNALLARHAMTLHRQHLLSALLGSTPSLAQVPASPALRVGNAQMSMDLQMPDALLEDTQPGDKMTAPTVLLVGFSLLSVD